MYFRSGISPVTTSILPLSAGEVHPSVAECGLWAEAVQMLFFPFHHPLQRTFSGVTPLLSVPRFTPWGRTVLWLFWKLLSDFFNIKIWVSIGTDQVFNLELVKISCELTAALAFPTSLPPTDKSQLSSFRRFLSYHQALSLATELVLFPVVIMTLKLSLRGVPAVV